MRYMFVTRYLDVTAGRLAVQTAPATEPVTSAEAKLHCRVDHTAEDAIFTRIIKAARECAEAKMHRAFVHTTFDYSLDGFPPDDWGILLPRPPLSSVTSISYTDENGDAQTMDAAEYVVSTAHQPGRVTLAYGESWPSTYNEADVVTIRLVAGYGATAASVPENIKEDLLRLVYAMYHRVAPDVMNAVKAEVFNTNPVLLVT